jgi:hypothetical protein
LFVIAEKLMENELMLSAIDMKISAGKAAHQPVEGAGFPTQEEKGSGQEEKGSGVVLQQIKTTPDPFFTPDLDTGNNGTPLSTLDGCWAAIVAFYAALHLVDRLAARTNFHADRTRYVSSQHRAIFKAYNALQTASAIARYARSTSSTSPSPAPPCRMFWSTKSL